MDSANKNHFKLPLCDFMQARLGSQADIDGLFSGDGCDLSLAQSLWRSWSGVFRRVEPPKQVKAMCEWIAKEKKKEEQKKEAEEQEKRQKDAQEKDEKERQEREENDRLMAERLATAQVKKEVLSPRHHDNPTADEAARSADGDDELDGDKLEDDEGEDESNKEQVDKGAPSSSQDAAAASWQVDEIVTLTASRNKDKLVGFRAKIVKLKPGEIKVVMQEGPDKGRRKTMKPHNLVKLDLAPAGPAPSVPAPVPPLALEDAPPQQPSAGSAPSSSATPGEPAAKRAKTDNTAPSEDATAELFDQKNDLAMW